MSDFRVMVCVVRFKTTPERILRKVTEVTVDTTFREPSDKATITLPRNWDLFFNPKEHPKVLFPYGTEVEIFLGYDSDVNLKKEFAGYIQTVSANYPVEITCMDEFWKVKRIPVNFSSDEITLDKLLKTIVPGYEIDALEGVDLGQIRLEKTTVGAVLAKLKENFGLLTYMRGKTLVCGKYYSDNTADPVYTINIDKVKENNLEWKHGDQVIAKIKGTTLIRGVKVEYEVGEEGGDSYSFDYPGVNSRAALQAKVDDDYEKLKRGGFSGDLTVFGTPYFAHGRKVNLVSYLFPERNGRYFIEGISKRWSTGGFEQQLTIPVIAP